jgi:predicted nuclease of predicted toxin-antitoxin system
MTKFLVDEGCDAIIVRTLRKLGYDVSFVAEISPGKPDQDILSWGHSEERIVITEDRDFSELVYRDKQPTYGVVLVRISDEHRLEKAVRITELVHSHADDLANAMTTITLNKIKIRTIRR